MKLVLVVTGAYACLLLTACHGKKQLSSDKSNHTLVDQSHAPKDSCVPSRDASFLKERINGNTIQYKWFAAKAKVDFQSPQQSINLMANIRIRKDSLIWISFQKLGVEGARVLITTDTIKLIDRMHRQYLAQPLYWLQYQYNISLNYPQLEAFIIGNLSDYQDQDFGVDKDCKTYILTALRDNTRAELRLDGLNYLVQKILLFNRDGQLQEELSDYQSINNQSISFQRNINIKAKNGDTRADIYVQKVDINVPQRTEFSIPDNYEKL